DDGVEQADGFEAGGTGARNTHGSHDRGLSDDHHQTAANGQLVFQAVGYYGYRTGHQNGVKFGCAPAGVRVTHFDGNVVDLVATQVFFAEGGNAAVNFDGG